MCISVLGGRLRRLTRNDIEKVRLWRNSIKISQYMEYRGYITPEMQEKWFFKIDNEKNYFFIIECWGKDIGLINLKEIDYTTNTAETGIFIYDESFHSEMISYRAMLAQMDFAFDTLHLEKIIAHILTDNTRSLKFHNAFGFYLQDKQDGIYNQQYILTKEIYQVYRQKVIDNKISLKI